jgi:hypothetical protein
MKFPALILAAGMAVLSLGSAQAAVITYDLSGVADYTLGGDSYSGAIDFQAIGDTANVVVLPHPPFPVGDLMNGALLNLYGVTPLDIVITLAGVGTFHVAGGGYVGVAQGSAAGVFGSAGGGDFIDVFAPQFATYDLASNFGPISVSSPGMLGGGVTTDGGTLVVGRISQGTFSSVVAGVPEPATWMMMVLGFGGMGMLLRSRRARTTRVA